MVPDQGRENTMLLQILNEMMIMVGWFGKDTRESYSWKIVCFVYFFFFRIIDY